MRNTISVRTGHEIGVNQRPLHIQRLYSVIFFFWRYNLYYKCLEGTDDLDRKKRKAIKNSSILWL